VLCGLGHPPGLIALLDQMLEPHRGSTSHKAESPLNTQKTSLFLHFIDQAVLLHRNAIASKRAAELYDMEILDEGIEDRKNNYTRFFVLSPKKKKSGKSDLPDSGHHHKTSIIFSVRHVPGALFGILGEFAIRKIHLTKIESRPTKETPWEYNFYVDLEGHIEDENIKNTLDKIEKKCTFLKILGSYRRGTIN